MLYDILIIDDDFSIEDDPLSWNQSANKLLLDLIRDNLRVTGTSGEDADIEKLGTKDLSSIRYIFCDLHLKGIGEFDDFRTINSKLTGIITKLFPKFSGAHFPITIYINSNFYTEGHGYGPAGMTHFKHALEREFGEKIFIENTPTKDSQKNVLTEGQKEQLIQYTLQIYLRDIIIKKAIEVEGVLDCKLRLTADKDAMRYVKFNSKRLVFEAQFLGDGSYEGLKSELHTLQAIRNKLAHGNINNDKPKIINDKFKTIEDLGKYITSIDTLIENLKGVQ